MQIRQPLLLAQIYPAKALSMNHANWLVILALTLVVKLFAVPSCPAEEAEKVSEADRNLVDYFQAETQKIAADSLNILGTIEEWQQQQKVYR